jgi:hypothetical protein
MNSSPKKKTSWNLLQIPFTRRLVQKSLNFTSHSKSSAFFIWSIHHCCTFMLRIMSQNQSAGFLPIFADFCQLFASPTHVDSTKWSVTHTRHWLLKVLLYELWITGVPCVECVDHLSKRCFLAHFYCACLIRHFSAARTHFTANEKMLICTKTTGNSKFEAKMTKNHRKNGKVSSFHGDTIFFFKDKTFYDECRCHRS